MRREPDLPVHALLQLGTPSPRVHPLQVRVKTLPLTGAELCGTDVLRLFWARVGGFWFWRWSRPEEW
jgi:hypothetical protein